MSGSPKYNTVSASAAVNAAIARAAAERRRRRAERERRRAQAALEKARQKAMSRCQTFAMQVAAVSADADAAGLVTQANAVRSTLARVEADIRRAAAKTQLDAVIGDIEQGVRQIVALRGAITACRQADARHAFAAAMRMLDEIPVEVRRRFDGDGLRDIDRLVETARHATTTAQVQPLVEQVAAHVQRVLAARADDDQARLNATVAVEALGGRLGDLIADADATGVVLPDADAVEEALAELRVMAVNGSHREVLRRVGDAQARLARMGAGLDAAIDRMAQRRETLGALIQRLPELGFAVDPDSLRRHPDGSISLLAQRHSGQHIAVRVEEGDDADTRVFYMSDDMTRAEAAGADGEAACDTLLDIVEQMNASARADGFRTSRIRWDGDAGDCLPPSGGRSSIVTSREAGSQAV